jgi:hypothetical protein
MRKLAALTALALVLPGISHAAEPPCLTPAEFTSMATYALPSVIRGTAQRCGPNLPQGAYLRSDGERLASRYDARKDHAWPGAKAAFFKMGAGMDAPTAELFRKMPDNALRPMVDELLSGAVDQQLPTERCGAIDRLVMLLSPLPAENTAELIALAAGLGAQSGKAKVGKFALCPANSAQQ